MFELQAYDHKGKVWIMIDRGSDIRSLIMCAFERFNLGSFRIIFRGSGEISYKFKIEQTF